MLCELPLKSDLTLTTPCSSVPDQSRLHRPTERTTVRERVGSGPRRSLPPGDFTCRCKIHWHPRTIFNEHSLDYHRATNSVTEARYPWLVVRRQTPFTIPSQASGLPGWFHRIVKTCLPTSVAIATRESSLLCVRMPTQGREHSLRLRRQQCPENAFRPVPQISRRSWLVSQRVSHSTNDSQVHMYTSTETAGHCCRRVEWLSLPPEGVLAHDTDAW